MTEAEIKLREKAGDKADALIADIKEFPTYFVL